MYLEVLPLLHGENIGDSAAGDETTGGLTKKQNVVVRHLDESVNSAPLLSETKWTLANGNAAKTALLTAINGLHRKDGGGSRPDSLARIAVQSDQMAYFWVPRSLYFVKRDDLTFAERDKLQLFSYAHQAYMRVNFGAMIIDDNYGLNLALKGEISFA